MDLGYRGLQSLLCVANKLSLGWTIAGYVSNSSSVLSSRHDRTFGTDLPPNIQDIGDTARTRCSRWIEKHVLNVTNNYTTRLNVRPILCLKPQRKTVPNVLPINEICRVWLNTAKDRKGPQRTTKDPQKTHKGPQRSITQDHRGSSIMRELPDLQQFCLIFKNYFVYFVVILYFFVFFCEFWSFSELWRFMKRPFWDPWTN